MSTTAKRRFRLPPRYELEWGTEFWSYVNDALRPGVNVLDIGAGRRPTILPERRPPDVHYVGLDVSAEELEASEPGSYDEQFVANAEVLVPELVDRFDLIVAWQVLEHFRNLPAAADSFYAYARRGGWFVSVLSGRRAAFSIANRILPSAVGERVVARLMRRPVETVFPAHYDHCTESGLYEAFSSWEEVHVYPLWRGADYFERLPGLRGLYIRYEDWAIRRGHTNLATHYAIAARKDGGE
jgi:SAM-dependent methyltransferase